MFIAFKFRLNIRQRTPLSSITHPIHDMELLKSGQAHHV
jgi:hypothetical protein